MITITYDSIPALVTAFARLPNDAERLAWTASHSNGSGDPRAAGWIREEYWRHPEIWAASPDKVFPLPSADAPWDQDLDWWLKLDKQEGKLKPMRRDYCRRSPKTCRCCRRCGR